MNSGLKTLFALPLGLSLVGLFILRSYGTSPKGAPQRQQRPGGENQLTLSSPVFENNQSIPAKYTCDGENISPPLVIANVPEDAVSLALIVHDPDAPVPGGWTHWTLFNIDPQVTEIAENSVPQGAVQADTNFGVPGYGGPCPPSGTHHYEFKLWALDSKLLLDQSAKKDDIEHAMEGHIIAQTTLIGLYQRSH